MYPISYEADFDEHQSRLRTFFRIIIAIPWLIVAAIYGIGAQIAAVIAWFAIVFSGRYPEGLYNFNVGFLRMVTRVNGFTYLLNDEWPAFTGEDDPAYPIRLEAAEPLPHYSRMKTLFRLVVGIPVMILAYVQSLILGVCHLIGWFVLLFTGKLPAGLFNPMRSASAYLARAGAYFLLLTEDWPPFSLEEEPAIASAQLQQESTTTQSQA